MRAVVIAVVTLSLLPFGLSGVCPAKAASRSSLPPSATCGWIGARVSPLPKSFAESLGMDVRYGAIFKRPLPGSPAAQAGIEAGDVLTSINGSPLRNWVDFEATIAAFAPGDTIHLWARRNGQLLDVKLTVDGGKCPRSVRP
jgi:S1-C subfamily serine protease